MVSMFDRGLNAATRSGDYHTARASPRTKLEQAKSLSYAEVRDNSPRRGDTTPSPSTPAAISDRDESGVPSGLSYSVSKW